MLLACICAVQKLPPGKRWGNINENFNNTSNPNSTASRERGGTGEAHYSSVPWQKKARFGVTVGKEKQSKSRQPPKIDWTKIPLPFRHDGKKKNISEDLNLSRGEQLDQSLKRQWGCGGMSGDITDAVPLSSNKR